MSGKITRIAVTYTVDTPDGPRHTFHGLSHMRRHIRPDRLSELLDDLTVICEDLVASRARHRPGRTAPAHPLTARRRDNPARVLTADNADDLRWQIRTDYSDWLRTRS